LLGAGCAANGDSGVDSAEPTVSVSVSSGGETSAAELSGAVYVSITADEAKLLIDSESGYIILDARTSDEYAEGHISGAVVIPYDEVTNRAASELPDKTQLILVYCRSGRRSKLAAQTLAELGYTNVKEFGGIIDWPYETAVG
jgi:Rhodanese-related sulfurtransferase